MKNKMLFFLVICFSLSFLGCAEYKREAIKLENLVNELYSGPHDLRKMTNLVVSESNSAGGFFLITGGIVSQSHESIKIIFSWKTKYNDYITTKMDIAEIKVRFNDSIKNPVVYFEVYDPTIGTISENSLKDPQIVNRLIRYATIECRSEDWKVDISLPLENIKE